MKRSAETEAKFDRWANRAVAILEGRANGLGMPALRALGLRGHIGSMIELANRMLDPTNSEYDPKRGLALERLVIRRNGLSMDFENLSTSYRNFGDMAGYRYWLTRAERLGDPDIRKERRRFATRFPYPIMKKWGRYRPYRARIDNCT